MEILVPLIVILYIPLWIMWHLMMLLMQFNNWYITKLRNLIWKDEQEK